MLPLSLAEAQKETSNPKRCLILYFFKFFNSNLKPKAMFNFSSALRDLHVLSVRRLQLRQGPGQTVGSHRLQRFSRLDFERKLKIFCHVVRLRFGMISCCGPQVAMINTCIMLPATCCSQTDNKDDEGHSSELDPGYTGYG